jgi:opacity protein-like surface antigen
MSFGSRSGIWIGALILTAAFMMFSPTRAFAQNKTGTWDVTPFLGFNNVHSTGGFSPGVGVAGAYNWMPNLAIEGELNWVPDAFGGDDTKDMGLVTLSANGVYSFETGTKWTPYATLGIGIGHEHLNLVNVTDTSATGFQVNVGAGVKAAVNDRWTVRADLRHFHVNDQEGNWRIYGGVVFNLPRQ